MHELFFFQITSDRTDDVIMMMKTAAEKRILTPTDSEKIWLHDSEKNMVQIIH
jgi:hypothetical protein